MENLVYTKQGTIEGEMHDKYIVFKGIPYAKPPVGDLRWKAPQPPESWEGIRKADEFSNICVQDLPTDDLPITGRFKKEFYSDPDYIRPMSEDCLYLNIWAPKETKDKKYPVAFWIHGGGFGGGYNSEIEFDGKAYAERGIILVTVNYRLHVLGFFAHEWLCRENPQGISGNYGILDQIAAFNWVYDNIEQFGGDKNNITVFGQSAGSMSTQILVSSELTRGKISKAILQSGISCEENILATPTLEEEMEYGNKFVEFTKAESLEQLRNMPIEELMDAKRKLDKFLWETGKGLVIVPNVDGYVLKQTVKDTWKQGLMHNIPYMLGVVTDDLGATENDIKNKTGGVLLEECKKWSLKCEDAFERPSYVYYFLHELPGDDWGAFHSAELWYTFGTLGRCWRPMTDKDVKLSEDMLGYWTSFMKNENLDDWRPYACSDKYVKIFK